MKSLNYVKVMLGMAILKLLIGRRGLCLKQSSKFGVMTTGK